jgi:serine/threonine protein kinase
MLLSFFKEIEILSQCRHPNIVRLLDASFNGVMTKEAISQIRKTSVEYSKIDQLDA